MSLSFIPAAMAATGGAAQQPGGDWSFILFLVVFAVVFYFILWRPQSKRAKDHKNLLSSLNKGDEVVTNGGIVGRVSKISDDFIVLSIAEGIEVTLQKGAISATLPKGTMKSVS